jgi:hypothetical protein
VSTGLRVDEVAKLTVFQILDLPAGGDPERFTTMHVTRTKRLVERDVNVPNYLIPDLHAFMDGERTSRSPRLFVLVTCIVVNLSGSPPTGRSRI